MDKSVNIIELINFKIYNINKINLNNYNTFLRNILKKLKKWKYKLVYKKIIIK